MALLVYLTTPNSACAEQISLELLQRHLVACINLLPAVRSLCWWKGSLERSDEVVCIAKTEEDRFEELSAVVRRLHPDECPGLVSVPIEAAPKAVLDWIHTSTRPE